MEKGKKEKWNPGSGDGITPAKSKVSTSHWRLFDLLYFVSIEKQNLSLADSTLHSLLQILLRHPASFIKGHLLLLNVNVLLNFLTLPEEICATRHKGAFSWLLESPGNLGSPAESCAVCQEAHSLPWRIHRLSRDLHPCFTHRTKVRNIPWGTAMVLPFSGYCKLIRSEEGPTMHLDCLYLFNGIQRGVFNPATVEQWGTKSSHSQWSLQPCTAVCHCVQFPLVLHSTKHN